MNSHFFQVASKNESPFDEEFRDPRDRLPRQLGHREDDQQVEERDQLER